MDITLSILSGLGLRVVLFSAAGSGVSTKPALAIGIWEGVVLHQASGRSLSPTVDHFLAYGLRLAVDFLISRDLQRMIMLVLCTLLGAVISEIIIPHASLRSALRKHRDREKERERRHRHSRSTSAPVPIITVPLPPRVRAYKPPEHAQTTPTLPEDPPPQTSTPILSSDQPPTPPSFFLQETNVSPSPKPVYLPTLHSADSSPRDALPVRPRSGLASTLNRSPESASPPPLPIHLPTPPDSSQSANLPPEVPVEGQNNEMYDNQILGFAPDLAPIPEIPSSENNTTPQRNDTDTLEFGEEDDTVTKAQRVPDWLASQTTRPDQEALFLKPFSPTASPVANYPIPIPIPVRQPSLWPNFDRASRVVVQLGEIHRHEATDGSDHNDGHNTESDELCTPEARAAMNMDTDNEYDLDPLQTPRQAKQKDEEDQLSPLSLNVRSALPSDNEITGNPEPPSDNVEEDEDMQIPGSLSQNILLQPPLPTSSPLFRPASPPPESPPPPSPSTILSNPSDISILSTRIPSKLYSRGDELRQKARQEEKLRAQLDEERRLAEHQGRTMDAMRLKIQIRDMDAAADKLHAKAARRYFTARNPQAQSHKIDVHGLRPREAFDRIERAIVQASQENRTAVCIIVGKGLHSVNQQPTLKPAVIREMQRQKIKCEINPRNPGQLIVTLPKTSPAPP